MGFPLERKILLVLASPFKNEVDLGKRGEEERQKGMEGTEMVFVGAGGCVRSNYGNRKL